MRSVHGSGIFRMKERKIQPLQGAFSGPSVSPADGIEWFAADNRHLARYLRHHVGATFEQHVAFTRDWIKTDRVLVGAESKTNHAGVAGWRESKV